MAKDPLVLVPGIDGTGLLFYRQVPLLERRYAVTTTRLRDEVRAMDQLVADLHRSVEAAADRDVLVPSVEPAHVMASLTPRARMRVLEGHGHRCLIAPDVDLSAILEEWTPE